MSNLRGIFNMIKRRIVYSASSLLSVLSIVGCNFKGNTDMQTDSKINCAKWDAFANQVGIQTCDQAVLVTNKSGIVEYLKQAPTHFNPSGDKYNDVTNLVEKYVKEMAPKTQASEIVSVKKLADVLKESGFEEHTSNKDKIISIPYFDRDVTDETGKVTTPGSYKDLSRYKTLSGLNDNSEFEIYSTKEGFVDKTESAKGTAYVLTYKLNGSNQKYSAIVTVPNNVPVVEKLPLIMYAHGGDAGLSFRNMATVLQNNISKGIVAAPSFPGEPICSITTIGGSAKNNFIRSCGDASGKVINPAINPEGEKSPLDNDVNAFLGLHNAIFRLAIDKSSNKLIKSSNIDSSFLEGLENLDYYSKNPLIRSLTGPMTIGVSDSRGGSTLLAAVGRTGVMLKSILSSGISNISDLNSIPKPALFSSAALFYSPSSLLVGSFRIITQNLISGNIYDTSSLNALLMIPDLKKNKYFTDYIKTPVGQDKDQLNNLVGWVASSDITYLAPYTSVAMQNWTVGIEPLEKVINLIYKTIETLKVDKLPSGLDNPNKSVYDVLNNLTTEIEPGKGKSLLTYISEALKVGAANPPSGDFALKCNFKANLKSCGIYNILVNGQEETKDIDGAGTNIPKLDPFIDKNNIQFFIDFLNELSNQNSGIQQILNGTDKITPALKILSIANKLNIGMDKIEPLMVYLTSANIILMKQNMDNANPNANPAIATQAFLTLNSINNFVTNKNDITKSLVTIKDSFSKMLAARKTAPGSIIFMHSTQDSVVPYTQSVIAKSAMDSVFDAVYGDLKLAKNPLTSSQVPALGSQLFAFQPDNSFYAVNLGDKTLDGSICEEKSYDGSFAANYNTSVKKCFGNHPLSSFGDGLLSHGDSAVRTSRLITKSYQELRFKDDKEKIKSSLLYGDLSLEKSPSITAQFSLFNEAYNKAKQKDQSYSFYAISPCDDTAITGIRYLLNACSAKDAPLFNRTLILDGKQKDAIVNGMYDESAQKSSLTPTDIFTLWMDSSAKESSKASN